MNYTYTKSRKKKLTKKSLKTLLKWKLKEKLSRMFIKPYIKQIPKIFKIVLFFKIFNIIILYNYDYKTFLTNKLYTEYKKRQC